MRGMMRRGMITKILAAVIGAGGLAAVARGGACPAAPQPGRFETLIERHIEALGGEEAIGSIRSLITTSEIEILGTGMKGMMKSYVVEPCLSYAEITLGFFTIKQGFDGERQWMIDTNGKVQFQQDEESKRNQVTLCMLDGYGYLSPGPEVAVTVMEPDTLDGIPCEVIGLVPDGGNPCTIYLDASTHLIAATIIESDLGTIRQTYDDYRDVAGVRIPFLTRTQQMAVNQTIESRALTIVPNAAIDPIIFVPPAQDVKDYRFTGGHSSEEIPFLYRNRHIYLPVKLGEAVTERWFMLDSGAGMTVIDSRLAAELDLERGGTMPGAGAGGMADFQIVRIPPFELEGIAFSGQTGISYPISELTSRFSDIEVGGILGYDFLSRFVTRIDYERSLISFFEPDSFSPPDTAVVLEAPLVHNIFAARGTFEDTCAGTFLIDTGANQSMLQRAFVEENRLTEGRKILEISILGAGGEESASLARFDSLEIGGVVLREPVLALSTGTQGIGAFEGISGIIGNDILANFTVTFDYDDQRVLLERNGRFGEPAFRDKSGLMLARSDSAGVRVYLVIPGTPADRAGIRVGDEILGIDGAGAAGFESLEEITALFEAEDGTERRLEIRRGGEMMQVTVVLETYL